MNRTVTGPGFLHKGARRSGASLGFKSTISEQGTFNLKLNKFKIKTTFLWIDL